MKISIISDMHLGYPRFEEDSFIQAENAFLDADSKSDLIICAGDVFDTKIPKLEAIKRAAAIFRKVSKPIFVIHGNHERRSSGMTNPVQLLSEMDSVRYLHAKGEEFVLDGEKLFIFGIGSVPEELASAALSAALKGKIIPQDAFKILVLHQTVAGIVPGEHGHITLEELDASPFDLIVNGHIHETKWELNGKLIIPGSTVVTQLKKEETEPRGYILYDTKTKSADFVPIVHRAFIFEELEFKDAGIADVNDAVGKKVAELRAKDPNAIIKIKIKGKLKEGMLASDIGSIRFDDKLVFIDNSLGAVNMKERIEKIKKSKDERLSVREFALKELEASVSGKITLFKPSELFDKLCEGVEEAEVFLKSGKN
jgi:DNA repair exonuclease SbcCD nuclease subunit